MRRKQERVSYPVVRCCVVLGPSSSRMCVDAHVIDSQKENTTSMFFLSTEPARLGVWVYCLVASRVGDRTEGTDAQELGRDVR